MPRNSKSEHPMITELWRQKGGTLVREFPLVRTIRGVQQRRVVDALILTDRPRVELEPKCVTLSPSENVLVVQAKSKRLCRVLMGQAVFSPRLLVKHHRLRKAQGVLLCTTSESPALQSELRDFDVEIVLMPHMTSGQRGFSETPNRELRDRWRASVSGSVEYDTPIPLPGLHKRITAHALWTRSDCQRFSVTCCQTRWGLGMWGLGHSLFTARLATRAFGVRHEPLIVAHRDDAAIRALADQQGIRVVIQA